MTGVNRHVHFVHSEVTREPGHCGHKNGSQIGGVWGRSGAECYALWKHAMYVLCMFCGEFVQVQTSPGL